MTYSDIALENKNSEHILLTHDIAKTIEESLYFLVLIKFIKINSFSKNFKQKFKLVLFSIKYINFVRVRLAKLTYISKQLNLFIIKPILIINNLL
jgi:hypothetical protein